MNTPEIPTTAAAASQLDNVEAQLHETATQSKDAETVQRLMELKDMYGATWNDADDPENPYNWSSRRKIWTGTLFSFGQLVTLMSSGMMAAALDEISHDARMSPSATLLASSIYFLGLATGPLFIAAWSEMDGRKRIWIFSNLWYILWNSVAPINNSKALLISGRLLSGVGASAGITLTQPTMADMYGKSHRGRSIALATFLPYLGPALGPIIGGLATGYVSWHWLFWILSFVDAMVVVLGIFTIKESYTPVLLKRKAAKNDDNENEKKNPRFSGHQEFWNQLAAEFASNLKRPVMLLVKQPVVQLIALVMALNFGTYVLMISTTATMWLQRYHQSATVSSLHYLAFSVGATISAQIGGRAMDWSYKKLRKRYASEGQAPPELRVPFMYVGAILSPIGLLWYGWSVEARLHWIMPDIGAVIFTSGNFIFSQGMMAYLLDEFGEFSASATAASRIVAYAIGFAFPIFAPQLYGNLGYGWGSTLFAMLTFGLGLPAPVVLWFWGPKLRRLRR